MRWRIVIALAAATLVSAVLLGSMEKAAAPLSVMQLLLNNTAFELEVADTPAAQTRGLGGRAAVAPDGGMVFLFSDTHTRIFWMKDMQIPIDIIWLRDGIVIGIESDVPPPSPGTAEGALVRYQSPEAVDAVIELAAGRAAAIGLVPGQRVDVPLR